MLRRSVLLFGVLAALGLGLMMAPPRARADGIGIFPTVIEYSDVLRGGEYYATVGVVNDGSFARRFSFSADGAAAAWISFVDVNDRSKPIESIEVPANSDGFALARLRLPKDLANGRYEGAVRAITAVKTDALQGSGALVQLAAQADVAISVTGTQRLSGSLIDATATDTEVGMPLRIRTFVGNTGNVAVTPTVLASMSERPQNGDALAGVAGKPVGSRKFTAERTLYPNEQDTIVSEWPTDNLAPGSYATLVAVSFGPEEVGSKLVVVQVHPRGTLTRQGELLSLRLLNEPQPGGLAKVSATFVNNGEIDSRAVFSGELYRGGNLIKSVTGLEKLVSKGEQTSLEILVEVPQKGSYKLLGKVSFEGKETPAKELGFKVGTGLLDGGGSYLYLAAAVGLVAAGSLMVVVAVWSRRRRTAAVAG